MPSPLTFVPRWLLVALLVAPSLACERHDPIVDYEVPKHELIQIPLDVPDREVGTGELSGTGAPPLQAEFENPSDRILGAVVLTKESSWFFKGSGPIAEFPEGIEEQFDTFLTSLEFGEGAKPAWKLPENWEELPAGNMRVATIRAGGAEFSVTKLPLPQGGEREYVVSNVNRWRRQLTLTPLDSPQLAQASHKISTADGHDVLVVDSRGVLDSSSLPPMAGGGSGMPGAPSAPFAPSASSAATAAPGRGSSAGTGVGPSAVASEQPFGYKLPEGWESRTPGMMQSLLFEVAAGNDTGKVSAVALGGQAGGVLANFNRWRGQVGLEPVASEADIDSQKMVVGKVDAVYMRIDGDTKSIAVAMVPHAGQIWFFKLEGTSAVVTAQEESFRQFLGTVELP